MISLTNHDSSEVTVRLLDIYIYSSLQMSRKIDLHMITKNRIILVAVSESGLLTKWLFLWGK